jgi:hypothetical protein
MHLLRGPATPEQVREMLAENNPLIKIVVDVNRRILAGGGEMHYEGEQLLIEAGSHQDDLWGANWYPDRQAIEFESLINIRPRLGNRSMVLRDPELCRQVEQVARSFLEGIRP